MADIKQAAKWLDEGREVRRKRYKEDTPIRAGNITKLIKTANLESLPITFRVPDLLAEDWELAD